jgi:hypothetical protein
MLKELDVGANERVNAIDLFYFTSDPTVIRALD